MADFERDYVMRIIRDTVRFVCTVVLGKTEPVVDIDCMEKATVGTVPPSTLMYAEMMKLVDQGDINGAEDLLYERLDTTDTGYLEAGLAFYHKLTELSDDDLESNDYSREEVLDGVHELSRMFGIEGLDQFQ